MVRYGGCCNVSPTTTEGILYTPFVSGRYATDCILIVHFKLQKEQDEDLFTQEDVRGFARCRRLAGRNCLHAD
ncbi:hypothetical protein D3C72_1570890 [compost metagenome]